jgi:hypothetical protein
VISSIPSTLNFGSTTVFRSAILRKLDGYIQRKLIKALEDCRSLTIALCEMPEDPSYSSFSAGRYGRLLHRTTVLPTMPIDSYSAIAVEYLLTSGDLDSPDA